jgi:predicted transcriptional regulator
MTEQGVTARGLEKTSGVKNQVIGRVRNAGVDPRCSTLSNLFTALGAEVEITVKFKTQRRPSTPNRPTS